MEIIPLSTDFRSLINQVTIASHRFEVIKFETINYRNFNKKLPSLTIKDNLNNLQSQSTCQKN